MRKDPFARAMRVDKLTIAALTATLELYRDPESATAAIPTLSMITASAVSIRARCESVVASLLERSIRGDVRESEATVGAGAFPTSVIPSFAVALQGDAQVIEKRLRTAGTPVIGRILDGSFQLDLRTVDPRLDAMLIDAIHTALS
jgi:L-seryl-tRNA(Ser) seleniumtransferase